MRIEDFTRLKDMPDFQEMSVQGRQELVRRINEGTYTPEWMERPPPVDVPGGKLAAPGVLEQRTDVEVDEQGRVRTAPFIAEAEHEQNVRGPLGVEVESELTRNVPGGVGAVKFGPLAGWAGRTIVEGALPAAGAVTGGMVGAPGGPATAIPGVMLGAAGGEALNQALGITAPDPMQVGAAGVTGLGSDVAARAVRGGANLVKAAPGIWQLGRASAAKGITEQLEDVPSKAAVDLAYAAKRAEVPKAQMIFTPHTDQAILDYTASIPKGGLKSFDMEKRTKVLMRQTKNLLNRPDVTYQDIVNKYDQIGRYLGEWTNRPKGSTAQLRYLWGAATKDMEAAEAAGHVGSKAVQEARRLSGQIHGAMELNELVKKARFKRGPEAQEMLRDGLAELKDKFPPAFYDAVLDKITKFGQWPDRPLSAMTQLGAIATGGGYGWSAFVAAAPDVMTTALRRVAHDLDPLTVAMMNIGLQGNRQRAMDLVRGR